MRTEFEFIRNIKKKYALDRVGDDCAVLPKDSKTDLVVTADMLVEDIDFRLEWTEPKLLGHKALAVSLSDIAAMGGMPKWAMLSIGVPKELWERKFLDKFYEGWFDLAKQFGVELVGGDVSATPEKVVIDSIVGGEVKKGTAVLRRGARPGDSIFVSGSIGGAAAGLYLLGSGVRYSEARGRKKGLIARQLKPTPQIILGNRLATKKLATAMIDISDGLAADLYHICDQSAVGALIDFADIPIDKHPHSGDDVRIALSGGEDFELLFTSKQKNISASKLPGVTRIGEVTANVGIVELVTRNSREVLPRLGYRHF